MSIGIQNYVAITSGVAAAAGVASRELIGRLITENAKVPTDAVIEFTTVADVGRFFGTSSEEYRRAQFYFGFISKTLSAPKKLSFGRFARTATVAQIYGAPPVASLVTFQAITAGTLTLTIGGQTATLTGLNFSSATSYANVATILQTAVRAAAGSQFATATVTYDAVAGAFNFAASPSQTAAAAISVDPSTGSSIVSPLGWLDGLGAVYSPATPVQTLAEALDATADLTNNFGAFAFVQALSDDETVEAASWNSARNVEFIFCARVGLANYITLSAAVIGLSGVALTYAPIASEYPEMAPMMLLAATDYARRAAVQNYMFQSFALSPSVTTDSLSALFDAVRVNYYGETQTAGQRIRFYQRGVLTGPATLPVDMNTYANEMWFKDAASSAILAALLSLPQIPANDDGRGMILAVLQDPINRALLNGTISVGKTLSTSQRLFITEITDDVLAYLQVENIGYWIDCRMEPRTATSGIIEYVAIYTLIYSKDDVVRKVEGQHVLV